MGRPRKGIVTDEAVNYLLEEHPKFPGKSRARVIAEKWVDRSEEEPDERDKLLDRVEGPVGQPQPGEAEQDHADCGDPEFDGWATQRAKAVQERDRAQESGGLRGDDQPGEMDVAQAPEPAQ